MLGGLKAALGGGGSKRGPVLPLSGEHVIKSRPGPSHLHSHHLDPISSDEEAPNSPLDSPLGIADHVTIDIDRGKDNTTPDPELHLGLASLVISLDLDILGPKGLLAQLSSPGFHELESGVLRVQCKNMEVHHKASEGQQSERPPSSAARAHRDPPAQSSSRSNREAPAQAKLPGSVPDSYFIGTDGSQSEAERPVGPRLHRPGSPGQGADDRGLGHARRVQRSNSAADEEKERRAGPAQPSQPSQPSQSSQPSHGNSGLQTSSSLPQLRNKAEKESKAPTQQKAKFQAPPAPPVPPIMVVSKDATKEKKKKKDELRELEELRQKNLRLQSDLIESLQAFEADGLSTPSSSAPSFTSPAPSPATHGPMGAAKMLFRRSDKHGGKVVHRTSSKTSAQGDSAPSSAKSSARVTPGESSSRPAGKAFLTESSHKAAPPPSPPPPRIDEEPSDAEPRGRPELRCGSGMSSGHLPSVCLPSVLKPPTCAMVKCLSQTSSRRRFVDLTSSGGGV